MGLEAITGAFGFLGGMVLGSILPWDTYMMAVGGYSENLSTTGEGTADSLTAAFPLLIVLAGIFALVGLVLALTWSASSFAWVQRLGRRVNDGFVTVLLGLVGAVPVAAVAGLVYWAATLPEGAGSSIGKWLALILGALAVLYVWGRFVRFIVRRVKANLEPQTTPDDGGQT